MQLTSKNLDNCNLVLEKGYRMTVIKVIRVSVYQKLAFISNNNNCFISSQNNV